ncbi:hypothetical protein CPSG_02204 [Coccidioides posadasii str. Silveira]|uniref:Uncharacterized protein n=1 Tax=Coccidioides posadasii (strain RMSCC 757 / Silveira) TaxID=443226 RepID=E9CV49_COCPS|nr:hypothetical protein CPSG_02204 [Coccidioides posadasii str. Silveira]
MFPAFSYLPRGKKHQESQQPISLPLGPFPRPPLAGTRSRRFSSSEYMCTIGPWGCGPSLRGRAGRSRARFSSLEIWGKRRGVSSEAGLSRDVACGGCGHTADTAGGLHAHLDDCGFAVSLWFLTKL